MSTKDAYSEPAEKAAQLEKGNDSCRADPRQTSDRAMRARTREEGSLENDRDQPSPDQGAMPAENFKQAHKNLKSSHCEILKRESATSGTGRTERVILYSLRAFQAFREIALAIQRVLRQARNDWLIWFQSCLDEGPDADDLPTDLEDFIVWLYPNKIVATREHAGIVRDLIEWAC